MTIHDYHATMKKPPEKTVRVATLKARLSEYLRAARRGHPVVVYDRDTPIARLVPYQASEVPSPVRRPLRPLREVGFPPPLGGPVDSLRDLMDERQSPR
jgi:prevent-host-death family protein